MGSDADSNITRERKKKVKGRTNEQNVKQQNSNLNMLFNIFSSFFVSRNWYTFRMDKASTFWEFINIITNNKSKNRRRMLYPRFVLALFIITVKLYMQFIDMYIATIGR